MLLGATILATILPTTVLAQLTLNPLSEQPPAYKLLRQDEDWSAMRDRSRRADWSDALKYIRHAPTEGWYLSLGGEARPYYTRYVSELWGSEPATPSGYLLSRVMLHADVHFGSRLRVFTQIINGLETGRRGGPQPPDVDSLDVLQAFVDISWMSKRDSFTLRPGRQELQYGSGRLIDVREGRNVRRVFDAVLAILRTPLWRIDAFASKPVATEPGVLDDDNIPGQTFWAAYATRPEAAPGIDVYYIGLDRDVAAYDQGTGPETRHSMGTRLFGKSSAWDYDAEGIYQFGSFSGASIRAWGVGVDAGYTLKHERWTPRLGFKANLISGDRNPDDKALQTFYALFPRGAYFGPLISVGPMNLRTLHPTITLHFSSAASLTVDWEFYWRQSIHDGVYGVAGNLLRTGQESAARFIGHQPGAELRWRLDRHAEIVVDQAFFFTGRFLRESPPGRNTTYSAAWVAYKF